MRRIALLGLIGLIGCGEKVVDDPFNLTTDPSTDPTNAETSLSTGESESGGVESSTTDEPTTTAMTTTANPTETTIDPDSSTSSDDGPGVCGDGMLSGDEVCDGEMFGDASCVALGFSSGELVCNATCQGYATDGCFICGNGAIEMAEDCDGPLGNNVTCESEGFTEGTIACDLDTCLFDTTGCSLCGDGIAQGNEPCDGDDLANMDCASIGFEMGALSCNADSCSFNFTDCTGGQYIQDFEGGAVPAEFASSGNANWIVDNGNPIAGTWSAASGDIANSQTSNFALAVNFAIPGTVDFTHEESTEGSFDYLEFWIDNVMQAEWSGVNAAAGASYPVAAGPHTLEWRYTKDGSVDSGSDRVWVDDIMLTGGVPTG